MSDSGEGEQTKGIAIQFGAGEDGRQRVGGPDELASQNKERVLYALEPLCVLDPCYASVWMF